MLLMLLMLLLLLMLLMLLILLILLTLLCIGSRSISCSISCCSAPTLLVHP